MLKIKQNVLTLKGITLRGTLQLYNPSENLAVIFQAQSPADLGFQLCVDPQRGIVMQRQIKTVRFWVKVQHRDQAFSANLINKSLRIITTLKSQYNRKMFQKMNIRGWQQARKAYEILQIPIIISNTASSIRSQIKNQVSNSLQKYSNSREVSHQNRQSIRVGQSYNTVPNSNNLGASSSLPKLNQKKLSSKLDRQLDYLFQNQPNNIYDKVNFSSTPTNTYNPNPSYNQPTVPPPNLYPYQPPKPQSTTYIGPKQATQGPETTTFVGPRESPIPLQFNPNYNNSGLENYQDYSQDQASKPKIATFKGAKEVPDGPEVAQFFGPNDLNSRSKGVEYSKAVNDQRFLEIVMLAALAGFFAALGSNFKQLFN